MSIYIETELRLDSFDLIQIEHLISLRLKELRKLKAENNEGMFKAMADEQLYNYGVTMKKIKAARAEVKRIKTEADEKYLASLRAKRTTRK